MLTKEQILKLIKALPSCEEIRSGFGAIGTDDPYVNYLVDCITDEYVPYDEKLYVEEVQARFPK